MRRFIQLASNQFRLHHTFINKITLKTLRVSFSCFLKDIYVQVSSNETNYQRIYQTIVNNNEFADCFKI